MQGDISEVTGEPFYSYSWDMVRAVLRVLNLDEGKLARVTQVMVNGYQEQVDRNIDGILEDVYHVPFRAMNQVQPNGKTKRVFPGDLRAVAVYWTAGLLLMNEFQNLEQNMTDQATAYIEDSRKRAYALRRFTHRIRGQEFKSNISRFLPANLQPPEIVEPDF